MFQIPKRRDFTRVFDLIRAKKIVFRNIVGRKTKICPLLITPLKKIYEKHGTMGSGNSTGVAIPLLRNILGKGTD
jgi:hypothetical protein